MGAKRGASASGGLRLVAGVEYGVHGFGTLGDHRPELIPVDLLCDCRASVPDEISDVLDGHAVVAHDGYEGMPQLTRCPVVADARVPGDRHEPPADARGTQWRAILVGRRRDRDLATAARPQAAPWPAATRHRRREPPVTRAGQMMRRQADQGHRSQGH